MCLDLPLRRKVAAPKIYEKNMHHFIVHPPGHLHLGMQFDRGANRKTHKTAGRAFAGYAARMLDPDRRLCLVSEPGEWLGEGKTTIIAQKPVAAYLEPSTAIQIKVEDWTLIFDPGENKPFSVGMTFRVPSCIPEARTSA